MNSGIGKKVWAALLTNLVGEELDPKSALIRCLGKMGFKVYFLAKRAPSNLLHHTACN